MRRGEDFLPHSKGQGIVLISSDVRFVEELSIHRRQALSTTGYNGTGDPH
jgi:hypothetical protein